MSVTKPSKFINAVDVEKGFGPPLSSGEKMKREMLSPDGHSPLPVTERNDKGVACPNCGHKHKPGNICSFDKSAWAGERSVAGLEKGTGKFKGGGNPWHDPETGRFTNAGSGTHSPVQQPAGKGEEEKKPAESVVAMQNPSDSTKTGVGKKPKDLASFGGMRQKTGESAEDFTARVSAEGKKRSDEMRQAHIDEGRRWMEARGASKPPDTQVTPPHKHPTEMPEAPTSAPNTDASSTSSSPFDPKLTAPGKQGAKPKELTPWESGMRQGTKQVTPDQHPDWAHQIRQQHTSAGGDSKEVGSKVFEAVEKQALAHGVPRAAAHRMANAQASWAVEELQGNPLSAQTESALPADFAGLERPGLTESGHEAWVEGARRLAAKKQADRKADRMAQLEAERQASGGGTGVIGSEDSGVLPPAVLDSASGVSDTDINVSPPQMTIGTKPLYNKPQATPPPSQATPQTGQASTIRSTGIVPPVQSPQGNNLPDTSGEFETPTPPSKGQEMSSPPGVSLKLSPSLQGMYQRGKAVGQGLGTPGATVDPTVGSAHELLRPRQDFDSYYQALNQWRQGRDKEFQAQQGFRNQMSAAKLGLAQRRQAFQEHKWANPKAKGSAAKPFGGGSSPAPAAPQSTAPSTGGQSSAPVEGQAAPADPNTQFGGKTIVEKPAKNKLEEWRGQHQDQSAQSAPAGKSPVTSSTPIDAPVSNKRDTEVGASPIQDPNADFKGKTFVDESVKPQPEQSDKQWRKEKKERQQQAADIENPKNIQDLNQKVVGDVNDDPRWNPPAAEKPYDLGLKPLTKKSLSTLKSWRKSHG